MKNILRYFALAGLLAPGVGVAEEVASAMRGAMTKTEAATKTAAAKAKDGTEQTIHRTKSTAAKGVDGTTTGAKDAYAGVKEGTDAVVHSTVKGTEKTGAEVKKLGEGGMTLAEGAVTKVGEGGKTIGIKTADGTEHTLEVVEHGGSAGAVGIGKGASKTGKVTVHYVEESGKKVAHVFEKR